MIELQTEVCLAVLDSYLEKSPQDRSEKHQKLAQEALDILKSKQNQFSPKDKALYERFLAETQLKPR